MSVLSPHHLVNHAGIALDDLYNLIGHILIYIIRHRDTKVTVLVHLDSNVHWCCTIKVDIGNSKGQYIEKDEQEATKDGSESTKIQHGI